MTRLEKAGHRLGSGIGIVVSAIAGWPAQAETGEKKGGRWIVLLVGAWLTEQLVARTHALAWVLIAGFLITAWCKGTAPVTPTEPEPSATSDAIALAEFVLGVIGDRQGVHLVELLPTIQAHSDRWAGADKGYLRRVLVKAGIPVRKSLRVGVRTGIPGVHRDDAEQALERLTTPPVVGDAAEAPPEHVDAGRRTRVDAA